MFRVELRRYLVPMLLYTAFSPCGKCLSCVSTRYQTLTHQTIDRSKMILRRLEEDVGQTLAISLQVLPASRIAFSLCSSSAVHGVFVRPFFLPPASGVAVEVGGFPSPSTGAVSWGGAMPDMGALCWKDARLFRGFTAGAGPDCC